MNKKKKVLNILNADTGIKAFAKKETNVNLFIPKDFKSYLDKEKCED